MKHMQNTNRKNNKGFSLVEVVIGAAIMGTSMIAIINAYSYFLRIESFGSKTVAATYLLEEGIEGMRYIRDTGWTAHIASLSTTTTYYLSLTSSAGIGTWQATTTRQTYDNIFVRTINLSDVKRDTITKNISSIGVFDPNIKKITVTVSWLGPSGTTTSRTLSTYLANMNSN